VGESESDSEPGRGDADPPELAAVAERLSELQQRKRATVRWHMSRDTAERAIAAIAGAPRPKRSGPGKSRRRRRHKKLL
jgi:hypothetical protein